MVHLSRIYVIKKKLQLTRLRASGPEKKRKKTVIDIDKTIVLLVHNCQGHHF